MSAVGAITLFVADKDRAKEFYARAFDLPPLYEDEDSVAFRFDNLIVNLLHERGAPELIEPAELATSGSRFQLTIFVGDADAECTRLRERGVSFLNGPVDRPWGMRTAAFADPDGHVWEVAQEL